VIAGSLLHTTPRLAGHALSAAIAWAAFAASPAPPEMAMPAEAIATRATSDTGIEVRCFNIRYDNPGDGEHRWELRREAVLETIRDGDPDFVGLQEALPHQRAWLERHLAAGTPAWGSVGRTRERSATSGEANPLLHRTDRWTRLDGGTFWLSETPEDAGSRSWNAACPRIATWGAFRRLGEDDATTLLVVNTHFDHVSENARVRGADVIAEFIARHRRMHPDHLVVVMGDLNTGPDSPAVAALLECGLVDTHRAAGGDESLGTFHGFKGPAVSANARRIDFILVDRRFEVLAAGVEATERRGRVSSDHHPVRAKIRRPSPRRSDHPDDLETPPRPGG
jgi:endonuclease/exonuclease/phosphatase family metal-dependent hydrolase